MSRDAAGAAVAWRDAAHRAVCDVVRPWAYGTVVRATAFPDYFDYNAVRVSRELRMSADELAAFADEALAGLAHRRIDVDEVAATDALRAQFAARGWRTLRLVWMRHEHGVRGGVDARVERVPYDAVDDLRVGWFEEDGLAAAGTDAFHAQRRAVAALRRAEVLAVFDGGEAVGMAQLERGGDGAAEITEVYVAPRRRGRGLGTALTRAAMRAAGEGGELWICADADGRAQELYARLGFRPVWRSLELTRMPGLPG